MRNPRALETLISKIGSRHAEFHGGAANRAALAVELGEALIDLKAACGHGNFQKTVRERLPFSYSTASDFMKLTRAGV